jgi:dihydrofolate reductase
VVFVIGGASIYLQALPQLAALYLSYVTGEYDGDAFFPAFDRSAWRELLQHEGAGFRFTLLGRVWLDDAACRLFVEAARPHLVRFGGESC